MCPVSVSQHQPINRSLDQSKKPFGFLSLNSYCFSYTFSDRISSPSPSPSPSPSSTKGSLFRCARWSCVVLRCVANMRTHCRLLYVLPSNAVRRMYAYGHRSRLPERSFNSRLKACASISISISLSLSRFRSLSLPSNLLSTQYSMGAKCQREQKGT